MMKPKNLIAGMLVLCVASVTATETQAASFSNFWKRQTWSFYKPQATRVKVQVRASTLAWSNPSNSYSRIKVQAHSPDGKNFVKYMSFKNHNRSQTLTINGNFPAGSWKVTLTPMDGRRYQGTMNVYTSN